MSDEYAIVNADQFVNSVKKYVELDNKLVQIKDITKKINDEKKKININIVKYMKSNNIEKQPINITGGSLAVFESKRAVPVNRDYIQNRLTDYFKSETKASEVTEFIFADRETTITNTIKRYKNRK